MGQINHFYKMNTEGSPKRAPLSVMDDLDQDYDDEEDDVEDHVRPAQHSSTLPIARSYAPSRSRALNSSSERLLQAESISMGTLSDTSRYSSRTTDHDDLPSGYTTTTTLDGYSDHDTRAQTLMTQSMDSRKGAEPGRRKSSATGSVRFDVQEPNEHHKQDKKGKVKIRKSIKDMDSEVYENRYATSPEEESNLIKPDTQSSLQAKRPSQATLQVPDLAETDPVRRVPGRKKSSSPSIEIDVQDIENDPDFGEDFEAMVRQRRRSMRSKSRRGQRRSQRHSSSRSREGRNSDSGLQEEASYVDIFKADADTSSEDEIRDNIYLQKDIIASIRTQPWNMKRKLKTLRLAKAYVEKYEGRLSRGHGYQEAGARYWRLFKREFMNLVSFFVPWEMRIKRIESHFGSVVASYFTFLRWMFWVNIVLTVICTGFIVVPEILVGAPSGSTQRKSVPESEKERALNMETILDWGGYIKYSVLFYGYYSDEQVLGKGYRLPLAYFLAGLATYAISFIIILRRMAHNSRLLNMSSKDEQYVFSWKVFTTWDYMIGNAETSKNKAAEIATNFKESISEEQEKKKKQNTKTLILLRILANILVCIVIASSTYAIYLLVKRSNEVEERVARGEKVNWFVQNEVSLAMSLITSLFPSIFDLIGMMEKYHPRVNLRWQLGRILLLYFMNLYTLIFALYGKILDLTEAAKNKTVACNMTVTVSTPLPVTTIIPESYNVTADPAPPGHGAAGGLQGYEVTNCTQAGSSTATTLCWETMIGQEISKLAFFDTVTTVGMIILIDFIRGLCVRYLNRCCCWDLEKKFPEYGEFKIAENLLHLIYNQATVWMGTFFAPMLPGLNLVKLVIMLYIRSWAVLVCNIPHERVFRASRSNNFYYALTLLMLFLTTLMIGFLLVSLQPSPDCGPFTAYERSYQVFTQTLEEELPSWARPIMDYIASPGIIIPLFLLLFMIIYYLASVTRSLKDANKDLREQLLYERTEEKRKIYAMADGRSKDKNAASNDSRALARQQQGSAETSSKPIKVIRVPGISPHQAAALREKNPKLRIMTAQEAKRLNILPDPGDRVRGGATGREEQELEVRRLPALQGPMAPPVAVVHGNPLTPSHPRATQSRSRSAAMKKNDLIQLENIV